MKNNSKKGFIVPMLLAIIALLVLGSGVYIYQNKKAKTPIVVGNEEQQSNIQISPVNTQTNNANWKTYTNTQYGFEFKYPSDYSLKESSIYFSEEIPEGKRVFMESPTCKTLVTGGGPWPKDCVSFNLLIQKNKISIATDGVIVIKTATQVAGYFAERVEDNSGGMWDGLSQIYVQFEKGGDWYISYLSYNSENKTAAENLFNQILSTFKFTK
ncbi:TPA: hypothetical protein DEQ22_02420 [Candidatus Nomurabacteria bacterium]|uniref:PsbP C-terminal domain-containing protein n=2 Tax=Candidatus Nomuraibacteriota TaxID=1752729 RepID=A0A1F6YNG5_9BACT|nr:MAG: hypothetical protein UV13_C0005G0042 [Parcubacteria group bacterium GW2011_GWC1_42_21]KKT00573.1 MAG: hypothetical protein UV77_C0002G0042 [Candidatus Nomurabacteria bacterium GW2011_GWA1_43_17]KKT07726.1 MAG: hypothetical protein UV85_C0006G0011 [Candidatus Nomurabacteria bacterium GW2011_GWB1_43_19]KKT11748.1 MAG: hypothetical protein UV91_C0002G0042 [Candidatus Nomurabacteria bacterium GW2011_GWF2_43_24]KKT17986.1 MAG: hypothetical protein UW01_C0006G0042 [Candidatus Nomurabacteria b